MSEQMFHIDSDNLSLSQNDLRQKYESLKAGEEMSFVFQENPESFIRALSLSNSDKFSYEQTQNGPQQWTLKIKRKKESCCGFCGGE